MLTNASWVLAKTMQLAKIPTGIIVAIVQRVLKDKTA